MKPKTRQTDEDQNQRMRKAKLSKWRDGDYLGKGNSRLGAGLGAAGLASGFAASHFEGVIFV
jgi:hypothetical protein